MEAEWETVDFHVQPKTTRWRLQAIYNITITGQAQIWQVGFDGIENITTQFGHVGGAITTVVRQVKLNSSGRNIHEQALLQARKEYKDMFDKGYRPPGSEETREMPFMTGLKYDPVAKMVFPQLISPKLDGIRWEVWLSGGKLRNRTRKNTEYTHVTSLAEDVKRFFPYLPTGARLQCEFYKHGWSFERIVSAVKSTVNINPELAQIELHIFDVYYEENPPYWERYNRLVSAYQTFLSDDPQPPTKLAIVPCQPVVSKEDIEKGLEQAIKSGFEGLIIRDPQKQYKGGRGKCFLKYKLFDEEEATVVGVKEAEGTDKGSAVLCVMDEKGARFDVRPAEPLELRRYWFTNPQVVMGKAYTVKFQGRSETGVPRFPTGKGFRDYE